MTSPRFASPRQRGTLVAAVALVACWSATPQPTTTPVTGGGGGALATVTQQGLEGAYWCSITSGAGVEGQDQFTYPKYRCAISREDGRLVLAKLGGSQRFTGDIVASADNRGFSFAGQFYCPWGACTQPLHGDFHTNREGVMLGRFTDANDLHVRLWRATDGGGGGTSGYGGVGYGGTGYGGYSYGAFGYGRSHRGPGLPPPPPYRPRP